MEIEFWWYLFIGWRIVDVLESSIVSTKFHVDRERRVLYEFSVEKLVLLSFGGYLGDIEWEKKK